MLLDLIFLVLISVLFFLRDKNRCGVGDGVLFLHHFVNLFINFGWLSGNFYTLLLYAFAPLVTLVHWLTNNGKCILSVRHNELCGRPSNVPFDDFWNQLGLKKYGWWNHFGHYVLLAALFTMTWYKLRKWRLRRSFVY